MRVHLALLLYLVVALTFACASQRSLNPLAKSDEVVLEVVTTASGMVYPKEGDILNFRLYESGRFQYDDYPDQNLSGVITQNVVITNKEAKVSADDVRELISLAEQPDFLAAKESYPGLHPHIDDESIITIIFTHHGRRKKILAVDFWDMLSYPEDRAIYPVSMVRLLERVEELKVKARVLNLPDDEQ
ncbi:MAG: hypothetical protein M3371_01635 [Acidobacteriota bacterium]|nr:hypothetical protein [Acidobacteriota bacterium]